MGNVYFQGFPKCSCVFFLNKQPSKHCEIHPGHQVLHLIHDKAAAINNVNSNSNLISKA